MGEVPPHTLWREHAWLREGFGQLHQRVLALSEQRRLVAYLVERRQLHLRVLLLSEERRLLLARAVRILRHAKVLPPLDPHVEGRGRREGPEDHLGCGV